MAVGDDRVVVERGAGRGTTLLAWLALIIGVIALWVAWMAYDRTGEDLETQIREQVQQSVQGIERGVDNAGDALDAGPDGVDEDDTDTDPGTGGTEPSNPDGTTQNQ